MLLQSQKSLFTFSINHGHVYVEQTHNTISSIFHSRRLSICRPRYPLGDRADGRFNNVIQDILRYSGFASQFCNEFSLRSNDVPIVVVKDYIFGADQFL